MYQEPDTEPIIEKRRSPPRRVRGEARLTAPRSEWRPLADVLSEARRGTGTFFGPDAATAALTDCARCGRPCTYLGVVTDGRYAAYAICERCGLALSF